MTRQKTVARKSAVKTSSRTTLKRKAAQKKRSKILSGTAAVNEYMKAIEHPFKAEIEAVRAIIVNANSKVSERLKWNAPSFFCDLDMAAFNPRAKGFVQLIFIYPKGAPANDGGLLQGEWKDRREARFYDLNDVQAKKAALEKVVNDWLASLGK